MSSGILRGLQCAPHVLRGGVVSPGLWWPAASSHLVALSGTVPCGQARAGCPVASPPSCSPNSCTCPLRLCVASKSVILEGSRHRTHEAKLAREGVAALGDVSFSVTWLFPWPLKKKLDRIGIQLYSLTWRHSQKPWGSEGLVFRRWRRECFSLGVIFMSHLPTLQQPLSYQCPSF